MSQIAALQWNVVFADPDENARRAIEQIEMLARSGVELVALPEAFLTGYCARDAQEARRISIPRDHAAIQALQMASDRLGVTIIVGFAEDCGSHLANSAAICIPGQPTEVFQKIHLPELGLDKHVEGGQEFRVFETPIGRVGVLICFDLRPPEASRMLTLMGADLIVLPTNWPEGAEVSADHICIARAAENKVFFLTCNRVGEENGFHFIGRSKIIGPKGHVLAAAEADETVLVADVDLTEARNKQNVTIPGVYETAILASRRPELYGLLVTEPDPRR
ncbi:MAG TPA: carbon-nitrogen hydrolase family protein [Fimbriimonadaceae bacterium]|nr:carbon-nitrogen hydrolase family protein [Fimbriimonadaceae bacterium]HRJ32082.1 carbon-nitrogen hydrolase family protein [Fimbriimonadaceae bacterium]